MFTQAIPTGEQLMCPGSVVLVDEFARCLARVVRHGNVSFDRIVKHRKEWTKHVSLDPVLNSMCELLLFADTSMRQYD